MKKNKLFTLVVVVTLGLGAAAPIAVAFADTGDTSQETEGPKSAQEWGVDISAQEDLISKVTYAMENPQLYTEESWNSFMYDNPGGMYMADWVSTASYQMYQPVHSSITEAQEQMDAIISAITPLYQKLVLVPVEPVEPVEPEVQYTTVTIELRGKEKGESLGLIILENQEIGSEVEITPPVKEGFVTPPAFKVVVTDGFSTILYYQTVPVDPEPTEPTEPVKPTEPTEPVKPVEPTDPDGEDGDGEKPKPGEDDGEDKTPETKPEAGKDGDKTPADKNTDGGNNSDKGADTGKKEEAKKDNSKSEGKETPKPKEAEKADPKAEENKLFTDADGLAKTSLSSENNNRSLIGLVVGIFAVLGGLIIAFKERITHKN